MIRNNGKWLKLTNFVEKDLEVQQRKMLIQEKSDEKSNSKQKSGKLVRMVHILLNKVLRRIVIFVMK